MKKLLVWTILILLLATATVYAATEFVSTIKAADGDYSSLASWVAAQQCDLTSSQTKVFSSTKTGTINDGATVTVTDKVATVVHATAAQAFLKDIRTQLIGTVTFTNASAAVTGSGTVFLAELSPNDYLWLEADKVWARVSSIASDTSLTLTAVYSGTGGTGVAYKKSGSLSNGNRLSVDGSNYLDLTNAGDSVIAAAECYPIAAGDGAVTISGFTTNAVNYVHIYAPAAYTHTGKWMAYTSCYTIYTTSVHWAMSANVSNILIEGIQIYSNENYNGGGCVSIALPAPAGEQIYNRVIFRGKNSSNRCDGFGITTTGQGTLIRLQNCVFFNLGNNNNTAAVWHSNTLDFYCFNVSVYYSTTGFSNFDTADKVVNCIVAKCSNSNGYSGYAGTFSADSDYNIVTEQGLAYGSDADTIVPGANSQALTGVLGTDIFVDPANGDCHLKSADTYARGHGTNLSSVTSCDIDNERPNTWNVGADQTTTEVIRIIRAGQAISTIARVSGTTTVTLSATYPNSNLKAGQTIVISGVLVYSFNGVFTIASVTSQTVFIISQPYLPDVSSTGGTAGGDYTTLTAWEAAFGGVNFYLTAATAGDLVTAARIATAECYNDWTNGLDDLLNINGWTGSVAYYVKVYTPASERHNGTAKNASGYTGFTMKLIANSTTGITIADPYVRVDGIAVDVNDKTSSNGFAGTSAEGSTGSQITNCIAFNGDRATSVGYNFENAGTIYIGNCIAYDCADGFRAKALTTSYYYNCTSVNNGVYGFVAQVDNYNQTFKNCLASTNGTSGDFYKESSGHTLTMSYCASSDGTATTAGTAGTGNRATQTFSFTNTTAGQEDYHLLDTDAGARRYAADLTSDANFPVTTDIDGNVRNAIWDIGADQTPTQIYRSVGPSATTALATGSASCTLSIDAATGTVTFSAELPTKVGVGDVIQYDDNGTAVPDKLAFINSRVSATQFTARQANGTLPAGTGSNQNWKIYRAYTSLSSAEAGIENAGIGTTAAVPLTFRNFDDWTAGGDATTDDVGKDLVTANQQWNIACYADAADTANVAIQGWTTGAKNYMKIYTPVNVNEVGVSQRHTGIWSTSAYNLSANYSSGVIWSRVKYLRIEGLQIENQDIASTDAAAIDIYSGSGSVETGDVRVSSCVLKGGRYSIRDAGISSAYLFNNIIYDAGVGGIVLSTGGETAYVYNNTVYNCGTYGYYRYAGTFIAKNNVAQACTDGFSGPFDAASDYNISNVAGDTTGISTYRNGLATTVSFVSTANKNFHLSTADTMATGVGTNLSADTNLSFSDDVDSGIRWAPWCIGADQSAVSVASAVTTGNWNTAATWASNTVPSQTQDIVIAAGKTITFDKNDSASSPTCGTLTVSGTLVIDTTTAANRTMVINGDIIVKNGGVLTIRSNSGTNYSTTIKFNCNTNVQYGLIVESGGTLDIQGTSKEDQDVVITAATQVTPYDAANSRNAYIYCMDGSKSKIKYANISYMGAGVANKYGIYVNAINSSSGSEYFYIEGCRVHHGFVGIFFFGISNSSIISNNCYLNTQSGIRVDSGSNNNTIAANNCYLNNYIGLYIPASSNNTIISNNFYSNDIAGVYIDGSSNNIFSNNTVISGSNEGMYLRSTSLNNIFINNLVAYNISYGISDSDTTSEPTNSYNDLYANTSGPSYQITEGAGTINIAPSFYDYGGGASRYSDGTAGTSTIVLTTPIAWAANQYKNYVLWASNGATAATNVFRCIESNTVSTAGTTSNVIITGTWPAGFVPANYTYKVIDFSVQAPELLGGGCDVNTGDASLVTNIGSNRGYVKNITDNTEFNLLQGANNAAGCSAGDTITVYSETPNRRIE